MKDFDGTMRLSQLKMLVAVADSGSFSAAAAELDCTQSRISHAIAELERDLGVRLLTRSRAGSVPTDSGHRVLAKARQMLRLEGSLFDAARDGRELAGQVRIACFRSVGTHLLPHALEALAQQYPGIRVDIDDSCNERNDVTDALREGRADLGVAQLPLEGELVSQPWLHDAYMLVAPASFKPAGPFAWPQLDGLPFIQLGCSGAAAILERCRAAGFSAEPHAGQRYQHRRDGRPRHGLLDPAAPGHFPGAGRCQDHRPAIPGTAPPGAGRVGGNGAQSRGQDHRAVPARQADRCENPGLAGRTSRLGLIVRTVTGPVAGPAAPGSHLWPQRCLKIF
jgi:DNA-binding transcriptional LysR family regulator